MKNKRTQNELNLVPSGIQPFAVFVALLLQQQIRNSNSEAVFLIIRFFIYVLGCILLALLCLSNDVSCHYS